MALAIKMSTEHTTSLVIHRSTTVVAYDAVPTTLSQTPEKGFYSVIKYFALMFYISYNIAVQSMKTFTAGAIFRDQFI